MWIAFSLLVCLVPLSYWVGRQHENAVWHRIRAEKRARAESKRAAALDD